MPGLIRGARRFTFFPTRLPFLRAPEAKRSLDGEEGAHQAALPPRHCLSRRRALAPPCPAPFPPRHLTEASPCFARAFLGQVRGETHSQPGPSLALQAVCIFIAIIINNKYNISIVGGSASPSPVQRMEFFSSGGMQESSTYPCSISCAWLKIIRAFVSGAD